MTSGLHVCVVKSKNVDSVMVRMQMNLCYLQHQVAATKLCPLAGVAMRVDLCSGCEIGFRKSGGDKVKIVLEDCCTLINSEKTPASSSSVAGETMKNREQSDTQCSGKLNLKNAK